MISNQATIAEIKQGYVGPPLVFKSRKSHNIFGFDIIAKRLFRFRAGMDDTLGAGHNQLVESGEDGIKAIVVDHFILLNVKAILSFGTTDVRSQFSTT